MTFVVPKVVDQFDPWASAAAADRLVIEDLGPVRGWGCCWRWSSCWAGWACRRRCATRLPAEVRRRAVLRLPLMLAG